MIGSGNEYEAHIKCVSEEEKYSGKNYKPKPNANKGEAKQESWMQVIMFAFCIRLSIIYRNCLHYIL